MDERAPRVPATAAAPDFRFLVAHPAHFIALGLGTGLAPRAPGTFGTLLGFPLAWALYVLGSPAAYLAAVLLLLAAGTWASAVTSRHLGVDDHGAIVIDEVAAFVLLLYFVPHALVPQLVAFVLFRVFDIAKPPPIRQADRAVKGGIGVMLDDLLAAGYALLVLLVLPKLIA